MDPELEKSTEINRSNPWQLFLFALNNGATNVYFIITMNFIAYFANGVLGLTLMFATTMVTVMRIFDGITDPIIGALIDKTQTKFGKFRPFMVIGNLILTVSSLLIYFATRFIPEDFLVLRYIAYVIFYMIYVIGYTFQTATTRSGLTCITNDPKQRPMFNLFNTVASLLGMGSIQVIATLWGGRVGFGTTSFFNLIVPVGILISTTLTILAILGIWEKDNSEYHGIQQNDIKKYKIKDYLETFKNNRNLRMLMIAGAGSKLASSVAQNTTVGVMIFACMMGNYSGLYLPIYVIGFAGAAPFFLISLKVSQKHGQKRAMMLCNTIALVMYIGVLFLLSIWKQGNSTTTLSFTSINLYTILFIIFYMIGFGSFYTTSDMAIPMVSDCSDYEIFRSGKYVPGMVGTLFSLVDKLVSSLSTTIVGIVIFIVLGLDRLPDTTTGYIEGINYVVILLFCLLPMISWIASLIAMRNYTLTGDKMKEIQLLNSIRKRAIANGMSMNDAMKKYKNVETIIENRIVCEVE